MHISNFWRCIPNSEVSSVINFCHFEACGGHFSSRKTIAKILQCEFHWPTIIEDKYEFYKTCENVKNWDQLIKET